MRSHLQRREKIDNDLCPGTGTTASLCAAVSSDCSPRKWVKDSQCPGIGTNGETLCGDCSSGWTAGEWVEGSKFSGPWTRDVNLCEVVYRCRRPVSR